jgi:hypothetical protein
VADTLKNALKSRSSTARGRLACAIQGVPTTHSRRFCWEVWFDSVFRRSPHTWQYRFRGPICIPQSGHFRVRAFSPGIPLCIRK